MKALIRWLNKSLGRRPLRGSVEGQFLNTRRYHNAPGVY